MPHYLPGYPLTDLYSDNVPRYLPGYHSDVDKVPEHGPSYPLTDLEFNILFMTNFKFSGIDTIVVWWLYMSIGDDNSFLKNI